MDINSRGLQKIKQRFTILLRGMAIVWAFLPLSGCSFNLSTDNVTQRSDSIVEGKGWEVISGGDKSTTKNVVIFPGEKSIIEVTLNNPAKLRFKVKWGDNFTPPSGREVVATPEGDEKVQICISGAELEDEFNLVLEMGTVNWGRSFNNYSLPPIVCNTRLQVTIPAAANEAVTGAVGIMPVAHWKMQTRAEHLGMQKLTLEFQQKNEIINKQTYDLIWDETKDAWTLSPDIPSRGFGFSDGWYHINFPMPINHTPVEGSYFFRLTVADEYGLFDTKSTPGFYETGGPDAQPYVTFTGFPEDESGVLSGQGISNGVLPWENALNLKVEGYSAGATFQWYIDGVPVTPGGTDDSLSFPAGSFSLMSHQVIVKMTLHGVVYSKSVSFNVK